MVAAFVYTVLVESVNDAVESWQHRHDCKTSKDLHFSHRVCIGVFVASVPFPPVVNCISLLSVLMALVLGP